MSGARNTSGKFSLGSFGRKVSGLGDGQTSPARTTHGGGHNHEYSDDASPSSGGAGAGFDGLGKKLGKSIAHQSLLPGLGNQDLRALQDIITTEKGVLQAADKIGQETAKAAAALPPYGSDEGPDLQDVLTQSSTLLGQVANAFAVYTEHSISIRGCFKRIREKEEGLEELRRRRKTTGNKAETAEKKLAKMGPENKALPQQTELLDRLRTEIRQLDSDIVVEESKVGDFKRQMVKEAMSYKFGGLEELGEKLCIVGELGKLLIEEVPLEETPPGYGRAPYSGYNKTENAVNEANKCLASVKFSAGSVGPKPPGLPPHHPIGSLHGHSPDPGHVAAAEQFEHPHSPNDPMHQPVDFKGKGRDFSLDEANPYGGFDNPYDRGTGRYPRTDQGATPNEASNQGGQVFWQGPTEEALKAHSAQQESGHDYEYDQQRQMDAEHAAWQGGNVPQVPVVQEPTPEAGHPQTEESVPVLGAPASEYNVQEQISNLPPGAAAASTLQRPWEPLNVRKDRAHSPTPVTLQDGPAPPAEDSQESRPRPVSQDPLSGIGALMTSTDIDEHDHHESIPEPKPEQRSSLEAHRIPAPPSDSGSRAGFHTPAGGEAQEGGNAEYFPTPSQLPVPPRIGSPARSSSPLPRSSSPAPSHSQQGSITSPIAASYAPTTGGGKISAAAFRRPKPRTSDEVSRADDSPISPTYANGNTAFPSSSTASPGRRLPVPPGAQSNGGGTGIGMGIPPASPSALPPVVAAGLPVAGGPETPIEANFALPASPPQVSTSRLDPRHSGNFADVQGESSPPPTYHDESLR
ncbi:Eisosome component PIL1-domain-containing protein [Kockovaella imperatae]|uniref:Eisosome component PIL1-domain-containing protein n=1 Tax=Kockovaella imperatae TaxID=4999 RepID=A0A1Y1UJN5_9TREE|nr:Eisosome component PIL1-domain-containing protein [Kockovaella imperatae]ORX38258.1 Eisosome component PIL1-domain-containing protein [Kockovaella imperatae]